MKKPSTRRFYRLAPPKQYAFTRGFARENRRQATQAEEILWKHLRNRRLAGAKFRRQHPIAPYVVDFVCFGSKLIVEVDGPYHDKGKAPSMDNRRTKDLEHMGFRLIRFTNEEVLQQLAWVLDEIRSWL
ncbi:MAG: endonuclease domain-containing protein [Chitinophagaceae bacterium]|nr:MAG: endonuclease domain-containing protein [Chitinophagaceae bacterium]